MGKRSNGEGTFTQRPNGTWQGRLGYTDENGERKRLSVYGATQREARAKLREARDRLDAGKPARDAKVTVGVWCEQWIATTLAASSRRASTKELSASLLRSHVIGTALGSKALDRLRPSDVDGWIIALRTAERTRKDGTVVRALADSSIARVLRVLRVCLDGAVRDGLLARNPARAVESVREGTAEARSLSPVEVAAIIEAAQPTRYGRLFALIAATGLRKGEALALRWPDVDVDAGTITVRGTLTKRDGVWVVGEPKTARSRRVLRPGDGVMRLLREQRAAQVAERLRAANVWEDHGFVFASESGRHLDPRNVLRAFVIAAQSAGVEGATVHTLRHAAASLMIAGGADVAAVSGVLGHARTSTTLNLYVHTTSDAQAQALGGLGAALGL